MNADSSRSTRSKTGEAGASRLDSLMRVRRGVCEQNWPVWIAVAYEAP